MWVRMELESNRQTKDRIKMVNKRKIFRKLVDIADEIDIWIKKTFKILTEKELPQ